MQANQQVYGLVMGQVVSTLRSRAGLTQQELAARCEVGQATISRIERGTLVPDVLLTGRLASALGVSRAELLAYVDDGVQRTQEAAEGALGGQAGSGAKPWWAAALAVAGVAGLAGLAIFAVAAALAGGEEEG